MATLPPSPHPLHPALTELDAKVRDSLSQISLGLSPISLALAHADWALHLASSPGMQLHLTQKAWALGMESWTRSLAGLWPGAAAEATVPTTLSDARFAAPAWQRWPFNVLKEGLQASDAWWREATQVDGMNRHHQHLVEFFARQGLDALSPSNWPWSNPEVLEKFLETSGQSGLQGWQNFLEDWRAELERRAQQGSDPDAVPELPPLPYAVGQDVAVTPGKVVFRNHLIELIQYLPSTAEVRPEPLLIVPSCIMKYYILDLSPENSMVRYLVGQGFTVFCISWRNPDAADRDLGLQDYLHGGLMAAMAAVKECTGTPSLHALGYCLGGTFLAMVAAALGKRQRTLPSPGTPHRRRGDRPEPGNLPVLATVTLLAAQTDFSEPGELGVFIDDDQLKTLRASMASKGFMTGRQMGGSFQFLNARDLVWSRNTRRYLLGEDEVSTDMMGWNQDVTRLPARMHSEYLSSLFLNNALAGGSYRINNEPVALMDIEAPLFVVGTVRDHVSPWRSVYKIHLLTDTETTFVLTSGGHNAGIISEPGHPRRSYQMDSMGKGHAWTSPDDWAAQAPRFEGSWWVALSSWLQARSGAPVPPPAIDPAQVLCDAPGDYVMVRYAD